MAHYHYKKRLFYFIPTGNSRAYEIMYFGVNLIWMLDYRLFFDIDIKNVEVVLLLLLLIADI
jgi:hypothetical protein